MKVWKWRHRWAWDLRGINDREHKRIVQGALNACDYPFGRLRKNTGKRVPVSVSDLSRYNRLAVDAALAGTHAHVHGEHGEEAHLLGSRSAALGLYWLPTMEHPAGRVEIHHECFNDPDLAREVFLAEAAHAVDYGAMTDEQRVAITRAYHGGSDAPHGDHGWFEERGGQDYWSWVGESFMAGFMAAFAPSLPRPLEQRQPWTHPTTPEIAAEIRRILK